MRLEREVRDRREREAGGEAEARGASRAADERQRRERADGERGEVVGPEEPEGRQRRTKVPCSRSFSTPGKASTRLCMAT